MPQNAARVVAGELLVWGVSLGFIYMGIATTASGTAAMAKNPALSTAATWAPAWVWGLSLAVSAMLAFVPHKYIRPIGFSCTALWCCVRGVAVTSLLGTAGVQPSTIGLYFILTWVSIVLGLGAYMTRRPEQPRHSVS